MTEENETKNVTLPNNAVIETDIKIGDECRMKGETEWYKVTDVTIEEVKTIHKGTLYFVRVYFGYDDHRPVWGYEIEEVRKGEE